MNYTVLSFDEVDSTNRVARERALAGAAEGTVIVANRQKQGKGRFGRAFFSPSGTGLYMSVILCPAIRPEKALYITTAAAVAVAQTLEELTGETAAIKWVNDVYLRGRKVCGILTEGAIERDTLRFAVLGIGINLVSPPNGFPEELRDKAGAVFTDSCYKREEVLHGILRRFFAYYDRLLEKPFLEEYRCRCLLTGKQVQVLSPDGIPLKTVIVNGIDEAFSLIVEDEQGVQTLSSGDVSLSL